MSTTETVEAPAQEGHRVYIGNLSFTSTEEQVRAHLATAGGNPTSVALPLKFGRRPGGFGFAEYEKEEDAKNVIEKLNGSELDGRQIKLDPARSKEETDKYRAETKEKRDAGRATRDAARAEKAAAAAAASGETAAGDTTAVTEGEGLGDGEKKKKKRPSKKRAPRRRQPGEEGEEGTAAEATDAAPDAEAGAEGAEGADGETAAKPKRRVRKPREAREARIDGVEGEAQEGGEAAEKPKRERKPRVKRSEPTGELSKTTIFVANLPYDITDEGLTEIFTNLSINVKSAKVVTGLRRFKDKERKPVRTSKGFGFVEVSDAAQQQEAVEKVEGTLIGDRTISAKIANEMKPIEKSEVEELAEEAKEAEAAATAPATAA